jgi:hypothetical protein
VFASTPSEATLETAPHAPQTRMVSSDNASQRGIPKIKGMAAREVVELSGIAYELATSMIILRATPGL